MLYYKIIISSLAFMLTYFSDLPHLLMAIPFSFIVV